jgi:hypothetical protein
LLLMLLFRGLYFFRGRRRLVWCFFGVGRHVALSKTKKPARGGLINDRGQYRYG